MGEKKRKKEKGTVNDKMMKREGWQIKNEEIKTKK